MFSTSNRTPLSLHNVVNRQILPALNRCRHCGKAEDEHSPRVINMSLCTEYERDNTIHEWHGFHAARRGLGSNLNRLGVDDSVIQKILRHSNISITQGYYIKVASPDVALAMQKLEQSFQDTNGTPNPDSAETEKFVN